MKRFSLKKTTALVLTLVSIFSFSLSVNAKERGRVNCDLLNVRVSPSTDCEIINQLPTGTVFDIIYTDNGWYNICMNGGITGFVAAQYVTRFDSEAVSDTGLQIATDAYNYLGYPYYYGGSGPSSFDCSGLMYYLFKSYGYSIPRTADVQATVGTYVAKADLMPGDLVFFSNRSNRSINHVGIYVGNNEFIHAATSSRGVVKDSLATNYYINNYITARRVV